MPIEKTVIGSFPKSKSPLQEALREVVTLQLQYGVDLITDGEQRCNMIQYFDQIPGLEKTDSGLRIAGRVQPLPKERLDDFYKINDYFTVRSILKGLGKEGTKAKITITGPMTLGTICASTDIDSAFQHYNLNDEITLYSDFSEALLPIVEKALDIGAYVQIDEPQLSTGQLQAETAGKILKEFTSRIPSQSIKEEKVSLHVCGSILNVPGLYDELLNLVIPILSFGFSGDLEKENFEVVSKASLEKHGKKLGVGFISNINVEDEATVQARYRRIEGLVGRENIKYLHPDCGFGLTRPEKVKLILKTMKNAADSIS
jgi:methionine synthase II (cobalamin-independent)